MVNYTPKSCIIELTLNCTFNCKYCGSKAGHAQNNELTPQEWIDVVNQLNTLHCEHITLIGGEVFLYKDWDTIAARINELGIKWSIITNGWKFTDNNINILKKLNITSISVSLDSIKEIHDKYRTAGSYERAKSAIYKLAENNIKVAVISTINAENSKYLEQFYEEIKTFPIYGWRLQACNPMGNAETDGLDYKFDILDIYNFVNKHIFTSPVNIRLGDNIGYYSDLEGYVRGDLKGNRIFLGCNAGLTNLGIDSIGNVKGCESLYDERFIEGNVRERSLIDIWNSEESFKYNRQFKLENLTGHCSKCKFGQYCAGGCRSYNYFTHNKLYESNNCIQKYISESR